MCIRDRITICCSGPGDFLISRFLSTEGIETGFSCVNFSYLCRIFGKGDPCFGFSMAVSAGSGTRRPQPATTSNKLLIPGINNLETKHNVRSQSRYLCVLHSCRPSTRSAPSRVSPRCHRIQIIPIRPNAYQVLDIDARCGTAQCSTVYIQYILRSIDVSCLQYLSLIHI